MSLEDLREIVTQLSASASALAALGAELQARVAGTSIHPALQTPIADVLREAGALSALEGTTGPELAPLLAELRHFWDLDNDLVANPTRAPGWTYGDAPTIQRGGEITEGFAQVLPRFLPALEGLAARLETESRFLDVGTGSGRLAIAMTRKWPTLRTVGLDVWGPSLDVARRNVRDAKLDDRIELREQSAADLDEERTYDLAWVPAPFLPAELLGRVIDRVVRALRPGGWLLVAAAKPGDDLRGAALRLRVALYGGASSTQPMLERQLTDAGLANVRTLPGPPRDFKMIVAGRRSH
jgi:SAM-dependent methyltransferase